MGSKKIEPNRDSLKTLAEQVEEAEEKFSLYNVAATTANEQLGEAYAALTAALNTFNEEKERILNEVSIAHNDYQEAVSDCVETAREIAEEMREAFEERSDRWRESDAGSEVNDLIEQFESAADDTCVEDLASIEDIELNEECPEIDLYEEAEELGQIRDLLENG